MLGSQQTASSLLQHFREQFGYWEPAPEPRKHTLSDRGDIGQIRAVEFSSDGKCLASASDHRSMPKGVLSRILIVFSGRAFSSGFHHP